MKIKYFMLMIIVVVVFIDKKIKNLSKIKSIKNAIAFKNSNFAKINNNKALKTAFHIHKADVIYTLLRIIFSKVSIFCNFKLKDYIYIKINTLNYAINKVFSQIIFN